MEPLPYYKWLWRDFRASRKVQRMDYVERGLYRELLDECWSQGGIPDDMEELADICGCPVEVMANAWQKLSKCFTKAAGCWINDKLDGLRTESDAVRAKRAIAGKSGAIAKIQATETIDISGKCQTLDEQMPSKCHIAEQSRAEQIQSRAEQIDDLASEPLKQKRKARIPIDFELTDARFNYAVSLWVSKNRQDLNANDEFAKFINHFTGNGKPMLDWDACWRTWCGNAITFNRAVIKPFSNQPKTIEQTGQEINDRVARMRASLEKTGAL